MKQVFKPWLVPTLLASLTVLGWAGCRSQSASRAPSATQSRAGDIPAAYAAAMPGRYIIGGVPPRAEEPSAPAPTPAPTPAPDPYTDVIVAPELKNEVVQLHRRIPPTGVVGQTIENEMLVYALQAACDVKVTYFVSPEATVVRTEPPAIVSGRKLTWMFDTMAKGESQPIKVWLRADAEGALMTCACLSAIPKYCLTTMIGRPALSIEKTGPVTAKLGDMLTYNIVLRNTGSSAAENVVLTDNIPPGLSHESGTRELTYTIGTLAPGETKQGTVTLRADERGRLCNVITARSSNAGTVSSMACTTIIEHRLSVLKFGPREQFLGKTADYQVVVQNPGDISLTGLTVTDTAPSETTMVAASGASVAGNQAVWRINELKPGERQTFTVTLRGNQGGTFCNRVAVATAEGLTGSAEACTVWRGHPAMLLEMVDDPDPIQIGDVTTYTIRVTNQGSANDSNIGMVMVFPREITPISAAGATAGVVAGKTVRFAPYGVLGPKQVITWTIQARAAAVGDARVRAELTSDLLKTPVIKEEATQVY